MKASRFDPKWVELFERRTVAMMFFSPSTRTRQSLQAAATEIGGDGQFISGSDIRMTLPAKYGGVVTGGETIEDTAKAISKFAASIAIRLYEGACTYYGSGFDIAKEFAQFSEVPVISLASDLYHPTQTMSDIMTWTEHLKDVRGKKVVFRWGRSTQARAKGTVMEPMDIAAMMGMNVVIARPDGYDLDKDVYESIQKNCDKNGTKFEVTNDPIGCLDGADIIYSRNWHSDLAYKGNCYNKKEDAELAQTIKGDWTLREKHFKYTNPNAKFSHCMPVERGDNAEVEDEVASGPRSIMYNVAENRLHIAKSLIGVLSCHKNASWNRILSA